MASSALRRRSRDVSKPLCDLVFTRTMGGGPRTFPGGLSKWQYKRMHEKMAREKEHRLLQQEKQLYQARLRSEIRANMAGKSSEYPSAGVAMSSKDHIKALADRFMKAGAEDLWNEEDGPISSLPPRPSRTPNSEPPLDLRKLVANKGGLANGRGCETRSFPGFLEHRREYSALAGRMEVKRSKTKWRRNSSSEEDESDADLESCQETSKGTQRDSRPFPRFSGGNDGESAEESNTAIGRSGRKKMYSRAALREHDVKIERRRPRPFEERSDFSSDIQEVRDESRNKHISKVSRHHEVGEESLLTSKRFDDYEISSLTTKALAAANYVQMTVVQEAALPACLDGKDVLVKAKTGTGKSATFLIPAIEAVLKASSGSLNLRTPPIFTLIICPSRELAIQVAAEANVMLKYHDGIGVQTLIGGTRFKLDLKRLESNPCQIIVATPGRLLDHIENKTGFSVRLMTLKLLILDEADHLLDLGFRKDIEKIVDCLPRQRQTLLFSATIPKEVRRVSQLVLKREHIFVDTVGLGVVETPTKILQSYIVAPHESHFHVIHQLLKEHLMQEPEYKVIVFCTTAMVTAFMYVLLRDLKINVREMHSRKPQLYRSRISDEFRGSKQLILVTSDVSARGMNYPDVTLVIQVGIPPDREQYIHRLGRTGREGKDGKGILLLAPWEEFFMDELKDLPIEKSKLPDMDTKMRQKVEDSIGRVDTSIKEAAYHAWLGYYNSISEIGRDKTMLADLANRFSHSIGIEKPPALFRKTALKMGLKDIPGIRVRK